MTTDNRQPIFIVGSGRSGTTILYRLLSLHPDVCWFSNLSALAPRTPGFALFHRVLDLPILGTPCKRRILTKGRCVLRPSEADEIYSLCGFDDTTRMTDEDLAEIDLKRFKGSIASHLRFTKKTRFLNKQTGNCQRIQLFRKLFPDAYYIHIIRDGRAVANSLSRVPWWDDLTIWWNGRTPRDWEQEGKPRLELCGLHWRKDVMEILKNRAVFSRYFELRYEDLVTNTRGLVRQITEFANLEWSTDYENFVPKTLPAMNYKWKENLPAEDQEILRETVGDLLQDLGYLD